MTDEIICKISFEEFNSQAAYLRTQGTGKESTDLVLFETFRKVSKQETSQ